MAKTENGADAEIANRITAAIEANSTSLLAISEETGIAYPTLRRSIKAGRSLSIREISKISEALNVPASTLLPVELTGEAA